MFRYIYTGISCSLYLYSYLPARVKPVLKYVMSKEALVTLNAASELKKENSNKLYYHFYDRYI